MSLTSLRSQGVYDSDTPACDDANAYFEAFQNCELTSGSVAAPKSPIEAPRASGVMLSEVTPVVIGLNSFLILSSANSAELVKQNAASVSRDFVIVLFIVCFRNKISSNHYN